MTWRRTAPRGPERLRSLRRRLGKVEPVSVASMTLVWMLLFNGFRLREESLGLLVLGVLVSVLIMVLFPLPPVASGLRLRPWNTLRLIARFFADLVRASLQVSRQVFTPGPPVRSSVIAVHLRSDSDLMLVCTSVLLSVIPGSVVIEVGHPERVLYLHVLGAVDREGAERARRTALKLEERIVRAIGTRRDIADLEASTGGEGP